MSGRKVSDRNLLYPAAPPPRPPLFVCGFERERECVGGGGGVWVWVVVYMRIVCECV